jgi:hypothetical protein
VAPLSGDGWFSGVLVCDAEVGFTQFWRPDLNGWFVRGVAARHWINSDPNKTN